MKIQINFPLAPEDPWLQNSTIEKKDNNNEKEKKKHLVSSCLLLNTSIFILHIPYGTIEWPADGTNWVLPI